MFRRASVLHYARIRQGRNHRRNTHPHHVVPRYALPVSDPSRTLLARIPTSSHAPTKHEELLDIVLRTGAGLPFRRPLSNPALSSVMVQLSLLGFAHESQFLADALEELT